jgi:hypothetical protein
MSPHREEREGAADARPAPGGGGDTETKRQKARKEMPPDLILKHLDVTFATYI